MYSLGRGAAGTGFATGAGGVVSTGLLTATGAGVIGAAASVFEATSVLVATMGWVFEATGIAWRSSLTGFDSARDARKAFLISESSDFGAG